MYIVRWLFSLFAVVLHPKAVIEIWDFLFAACPPNQLHTGFQRAVLLVSLAMIKLMRKHLVKLHSTEEIVEELNKHDHHAFHILNDARKLDKQIPQAILESTRGEWAIENPTENQLVVQGELNAIGTS